MTTILRPAIVLLGLLTLLTGLAYPLAITAVVQATMPHRAGGSLLWKDGRAVGSERIGQAFDDPRYFWGRPSATAPVPYHGLAGAGSNWGPTNPALTNAVRSRVAALRAAHPEQADRLVPVDLVTASGSGLDPHISPAAAAYQVERVARVRRLEADAVRRLVDEHTEPPSLGFLGAARVHVLRLNLALDMLGD